MNLIEMWGTMGPVAKAIGVILVIIGLKSEPPPPPPAPGAKLFWDTLPVRADYVRDNIDPPSIGTSKPDPTRCINQRVDFIAICWDDPPKDIEGAPQPLCIYKNYKLNQARSVPGGGTPGQVYQCRRN